MRLHPDDIARLFARGEVGAVVDIEYEPVLLAGIDERVWIEVRPRTAKLSRGRYTIGPRTCRTPIS